MNKCENPECEKEIPEGKKYCGEDCLRRHTELRIQSKKQHHTAFNPLQNDVWFGQEKRKAVMDIIKTIAKECLPMGHNQFASIVSYRTGLSYRKITDDYLRVLLYIGFLKKDENMTLRLGEVE